MISAEFVWGNVPLDGKLQIYAKNSNFENVESSLYMKSVSIPLILSTLCRWVSAPSSFIKGTNCLEKDMWDRPCLIQLETWLDVSDWPNFWKNERWKPDDKYSKHYYLFHTQNLFQNGANNISETVNITCRFFVKKIWILCSDHTI